MNWRRIESILQDYFGSIRHDGDVFAIGLEASCDFADCENCEDHTAEINISDLARYLADELGNAS
jgi:hypothetical protein